MRSGLLAALFLVGCSSTSASSTAKESDIQNGASDVTPNHSFAVLLATGDSALCTGTLIAPNLVLTARHCVMPPGQKKAVTCKDSFSAETIAPRELRVSTAARAVDTQRYYGVREVVTPDDLAFCGNDIALVTLAENIPASEATPATPVVQFSMTDRARIGAEVVAMGYGITSPVATDSGVRRIRENIGILCVPGDDAYDCNKGYAQLVASDAEFMTEGYVCSGDSGGGAFDQTSFFEGRPFVLGTLSRGPQTDADCLAAIYTRTDAHASLIMRAGIRALQLGAYTPPAWLEPQIGTTCEGELCTSTSAASPASNVADAGCTMTPSRTTSNAGLFALAIAACLALRQRRRSRP